MLHLPCLAMMISPALPPTGLRLPIGPPGPPLDDGNWPGDGGDDDEEEELVADDTPLHEKRERFG